MLNLDIDNITNLLPLPNKYNHLKPSCTLVHNKNMNKYEGSMVIERHISKFRIVIN